MIPFQDLKTVQSTQEVCAKVGIQFEFSEKVSALAAAANSDIIILTGALPCVLDTKIVNFNGTSIKDDFYTGVTYTGGTVQAVFNINEIIPATSTVSIITGATVTVAGTKTGATTYSFGTAGQKMVGPGTSNRDVYRILAPNTAYLIRVNNDSAATEDFNLYLSWSEGAV